MNINIRTGQKDENELWFLEKRWSCTSYYCNNININIKKKEKKNLTRISKILWNVIILYIYKKYIFNFFDYENVYVYIYFFLMRTISKILNFIFKCRNIYKFSSIL